MTNNGESPSLTLKRVMIDTYHENVAYMHRDCDLYRAEGFQALSKIEVHYNGEKILAALNVVEDDCIVGHQELGLSQQSFAQLNVPEGSQVRVSHASPPHSMNFVRLKMAGERLDRPQLSQIVRDIVDNRYSKPEIAAFLVSSAQAGLDREEVLFLTEAMAESGNRLNWHDRPVVDKHCIGGIPGNRTSMVVVPIVAAFGLMCPKTSSRAITSPAGTADTMEVLAQVNLTTERLHDIVREEKACLAWGGTAHLAPVDDILISVERPLSIDSPGQMVASIISKKVACGSTHLLIDIPVGPSAKVHSMRDAMKLRQLFEFVGDRIGLETHVIITNGEQPIGTGIGPVLEARDVMRVLERHPDAPHDLREKSLQLAGRMIEFSPDVRGGTGYDIARDILDSGRALAKMNAIIAAQGEQHERATPGQLVSDVMSESSGYVTGIDNLVVAHIARLAGAPMDKGAGVEIFRRIGDRVEAGEPLYRIYAQFPADFRFARRAAEFNHGYTLGDNLRNQSS